MNVTVGDYTMLLDDEDADLAEMKLYAIKAGGGMYISAYCGGDMVLTHRIILGRMLERELEKREFTDHINHNTLDNRRCNLRVCSGSQNTANRILPANKSGYRGVYQHRRKWRSTIMVNGQVFDLGLHSTPEEAARAYDAAAREHYGEFAQVNFT